ncbi:MAG: ABC transporter substrate-binding protein [Gemmatimonadaceae bacterium]|nr:ABC transporter substrate-binding protein [Gemmatimonadaceae bacterium]
MAALSAMVAGLASCAGGGASNEPAGQAAVELLRGQPWDSVLARARGTEVVWRMWRGDPSVNAYVDGWIAPRLRGRYGVTLRAVEGQGPELVNQLVVEREAGRRSGTASLVWINGETFANLRRERLLAGPWAGRLPNAAYVDSASPIVSRDFEQDPAGFESPWGRVQFALIHDTVRTPHPPRTVAELAMWIRAHPGRFTHDQGFTGTTFLKIVMYALNGGVAHFQGGFDSTRYVGARDRMFAWLDSLRPYFWRRGETFPPDVAAMHRLFANREIDFTMSDNENDVIAKARQGIVPATARPVLLRDGTIANSHYVGIPFNAPNAAGAMVVADFLLSPEAQLEKQKPGVWADGAVLDVARVPEPWRTRFATLASDPRALPRDSLARYAVPEVSPRYHERLAADWRAHIRARSGVNGP